MRADDLILFSQVVELGSFSKVAEQNNLTNSVVSKRIARLEEEIGVQLLYRTTRKLTLTEAGKAMLHSAKNVKQAAQEAMDAVSGFGENVSGHIKMSVPTISGDLILADAVAEFCNMHPGLTVDMSLNNRFVDLVEDGSRLGHSNRLFGRFQFNCSSYPWIRNGWCVLLHLISPKTVSRCSPKIWWITTACNTLIKQRALVSGNFLHSKDGFTDNDKYIVRVSGSFSTDNATALRKAALGGHGVAYVPRCLVYHDITKWAVGGYLSRFSRQEARYLCGVPLYAPATEQD